MVKSIPTPSPQKIKKLKKKMKGKKTCIHEMCVHTYLLPFEPRLW